MYYCTWKKILNLYASFETVKHFSRNSADLDKTTRFHILCVLCMSVIQSTFTYASPVEPMIYQTIINSFESEGKMCDS